MINCAIYDTKSGAIAQTGRGLDLCSFELACCEGQSAVEVDSGVSDSTYYIDGGAVISIPPAPSSAHIFSFATKQWVDPRTLAMLKAGKTSEINAARLRANQSTFDFGGKRFQCDALGRSDIDGMNGAVSLLRAMPADWLGRWKAADNSFLPIPDVATWTAFYSAMVAQGQANFVQSQALKTQVDAATTPEALALITWSAS